MYSDTADFVADFNGDGKPDLLSRDGTLQLGNGDGTFTMGTLVSGGALAIADFNGDGKMDVLQLGGSGALLVLLGNGDGTFQSPISTNSGASLTAVIAGDLNGDGKADALGIFNNNVVVYLSHGDGTFAAGVPYAIGDTSLGTYLMTLGDFNGDHFTDIAVSLSGNHVPGQEVVLLGNGDGTFQAGKSSTGVQSPQLAVAGDFNGDGKLDLVVAGAIASNSYPLSLLLGNGDGTFQAATTITTSTSSNTGLAAADLNGDSNLDLVLVAGITEVDLGNGDGTFSNTHDYWGQPLASGIAIADFNLDGKLDIAAGGYFLSGVGDGTFQGLSSSPLIAAGAVTGSFDKKGNRATDIAEISPNSSNSLYILSNDGTGNLTLSQTYTLQQPSYGIATGDLNGDGYPDLVVVGTDPITQDWSYSVLLGNGDGSFQPPQFYPQNVLGDATQYSIVMADFNGDHKLDMAVSAGEAGGAQTMAVLLGNGDGTFGSPVYFNDGANSSSTSLVAADFNGDGNVDIAASPAGTSAQGTALLFGKGDGTFQAATFPIGNGFMAGITADFNNDGKPDLLGPERTASLQALLGNGDGTFAPQSTFSGNDTAVAVGDINSDGILDVVTYSQFRGGNGTDTYGVYLGNGDGTFGAFIETLFIKGSQPTIELVADMNGDGKPDLISNAAGGYTFVLLNTTVSAPGTSFSPSSLTFSAQAVGTTSSQAPVILTNTGAVTLKVTNITVSGTNASEFAQTSNCSTVQPSRTCTINVTFTPTALGSAAASVIVSDNAGSGSQNIPLSGTGVAPTTFVIAPAAGTPNSATVVAGHGASFKLAITPSGSFSGMVDLACDVSPAVTLAPTCVVPASVQVNAGTPANVMLMVNTTASMSAGTIVQGNFPPGTIPFVLTLFLFASTFLLVVNGRRWPVLAAPILALALIPISGCGGSRSSSSSGTHNVTVTATSGSLVSKTTVTVIVQ
jgi:hypothetical protein